MNSLELLDKKEQLSLKAENILKTAEQEVRKLTDEEDTEYRSTIANIKDIQNQLDKLNNKQTKRNLKKMENFSLLKAIYKVANNQQLDERSAEVVNQGIAEMRKSGQSYSGQIVLPVEERADAIQATVATKGEEVVAEDKLNILEPLRANLVMAQAGATI